jgi:murein DD-endopeptidase MepM/ murein hydrolase activator NlpD
MAKKHISLIIVPHTKTSTKTLSFSKKTIKILAWTGGFLVLALLVFLVDYVSMSGLRGRHKALTLTSAEQTKRIQDYETFTAQLQATITNYEEYAKKLNIMAGWKSPDIITGPAGLGSGPSDENYPGETVPEDGDPQTLPPNSVQRLGERALSVKNNLSTLLDFFEGDAMRLASTPSIMPTAGWLSSPFGYRDDPFTGVRTMHWGIDISTNMDNPIVTTADGIVLKVLTDKILGRYVTISHGYGYTTVYGHMNRFAVKAGQKVKRGDIIGYIGMSGKAKGPHVHYEVRRDGKRVNPWDYFQEE